MKTYVFIVSPTCVTPTSEIQFEREREKERKGEQVLLNEHNYLREPMEAQLRYLYA